MSDNVINFKELMRIEKRAAKEKRLKAKQKSKIEEARNDTAIDSLITKKAELVPEDVQQQISKRKPHWPTQCCSLQNRCSILQAHYVSNQDIKEVFYIPNFLTRDYQNAVLSWLQTLPRLDGITVSQKNKSCQKLQEEECNGKWVRLKHAQRNVALFDLRHERIPFLLRALCNILIEINAFPKSHPPNHVLINEYEPQNGILPHTDGPLYLDRTATFSIGGGDVLFKFTKRFESQKEKEKCAVKDTTEKDRPVMEVKLNGLGSLIFFTGEAYTNYCHSINDRIGTTEHVSQYCINSSHSGEVVKRGYRISLTFRHKINVL